jgi:hypothetical protein
VDLAADNMPICGDGIAGHAAVAAAAAAGVGLGHIVALHYHSSTLHQIHERIQYLYF